MLCNIHHSVAILRLHPTEAFSHLRVRGAKEEMNLWE